MNLEELRSVQRAERQKDSLQHLRDSFYGDVAEYIAQLKDERERAVAAADDPFASEDVRRLTDTIESTTETANALYERRVGKVVKHASFAAADMATDEEGMTSEERDLFEDLVARIRENREVVLATLDGTVDGESDDDSELTGDAAATTESSVAVDRPATPEETSDAAEPFDQPDAAASPTESTATDDLLADALGDTQAVESTAEQSVERSAGSASGGRPSPDEPTASGANERETADTDRTTLRITANVGTVYGVDEREYNLAREDVIDLPTTNAEPLLQKDAAERID